MLSLLLTVQTSIICLISLCLQITARLLLSIVFKTCLTSETHCSTCAGYHLRLKDTLKLQNTVRVDVTACHLLVFSLDVSICVTVLLYLFIFHFPGVGAVFISPSYGILSTIFAEISLLRITTFSILISLVNVTNILLIFFSILLIII